ncbi:hypothetical protein XENOCAPTIV_002847 [Xenoophorus captivus]|uniref:Sestrin 2 n=1 Tax=Xenoophorus captivus TaxID=1517983 RepID=A0ABV0QCL3_9TELE
MIGRTVTGAVSSALGSFAFFSVRGCSFNQGDQRQQRSSFVSSSESSRSDSNRIHAGEHRFWKMIICTSKMEYPLRSQCKRVQKQVSCGYLVLLPVSWISGVTEVRTNVCGLFWFFVLPPPPLLCANRSGLQLGCFALLFEFKLQSQNRSCLLVSGEEEGVEKENKLINVCASESRPASLSTWICFSWPQAPQTSRFHVIVNGEKERVSLLFMKALVSRGSVDAVSQQMASHPQYLESFLRTQHYILHMDGPLPLPYRHYIAIMGLEAAPPRLRLLDHINKVLAHQPWLAACSHIQTLLKAGEQCWSLAELVQAVVILAHCHSLCSFVFGCDTDSDLTHLAKSPNGTPPTFCPFDAANGNANVPQSLKAPSEHITRRRVNDSDFTVLKGRKPSGLEM